VAAGSSFNCDLGPDDLFALARYTSNGALDPTFGAGGKITTPIGAYRAFIADIAIQSDGKIVAAGYAEDVTAGDDYFALARYLG